MTSLAVAAIKGGTGKSTIALGLAVEFCKKYKSVLILDGDQHVRTSELKLIEVRRGEPRLREVLEGKADWREAIYACCLQRGDEYLLPNLYVLPAGSAFLPDLELGFPVEVFWQRVQKFDGIMKELERHVDLIIIDTPANFSREHLVLLSASDAILPVLNPDDDTFLSTKKKLHELQDFLGEFQIPGCVLNRVPLDFDEDYWLHRAEKEIAPVLGIVHMDELVTRAFSENLPVQVRYPNCRASKELEQLAKSVARFRIKPRKLQIVGRLDRALTKLRMLRG